MSVIDAYSAPVASRRTATYKVAEDAPRAVVARNAQNEAVTFAVVGTREVGKDKVTRSYLVREDGANTQTGIGLEVVGAFIREAMPIDALAALILAGGRDADLLDALAALADAADAE